MRVWRAKIGIKADAFAIARGEPIAAAVEPLRVDIIRLVARALSGSRGRENMNVWQRDRTVGSIFDRSVVQKTKTRCGGGSSISLRSALNAASVS